MEQIIKELNACKSFYDYLLYIRDTDGLKLCTDNGWYWLEYHGEEIPTSGREFFRNSSEMDALIELAGLQ